MNIFLYIENHLHSLISTINILSAFLFPDCNVDGQQGNGENRGSCEQNQLCHSDGSCKPLCTVEGSPGNGSSRGTCRQGEFCFSDGVCKSK